MRSNWTMGAAGAALAFVVVALLGAGTALSNPRFGACHGGGAPNARLEAKLNELALAPETRTAAEQLLEQARTDGKARWAELRDARRSLRELLQQESPSLDPVMAQADAIGGLETESRKAHLRTMLELKSVLGPEAWQQLMSSLRNERVKPVENS